MKYIKCHIPSTRNVTPNIGLYLEHSRILPAWLILAAIHLISQDTAGVLGRKIFAQFQNGCATKLSFLWAPRYATLAGRSLQNVLI